MIRTRNYRVTTPSGVDEEQQVAYSIDGGALRLWSYDDTGSELFIRAYSPSGWVTIEEFDAEA